MQYNQFLSCIQSNIQASVGADTKVSLHRTLKNNNYYLDGLTILPPGETIAPTMYLNAYYQDFLDGMPLAHIVRTILELYERFPRRQITGPEQFLDFEKACSHIAYRLIHFDSNRPFLTQCPHIPKLDLAITFFLLIDSSPDGEMTITVTQEHMNAWGISKQLLYETAARNTPLLYPCCCLSLEQMISELRSKEQDGSGCQVRSPRAKDSLLPMYVLTNQRRINGAACILYDHVLQDFSRSAGGDFFILPSSIHETILIPCRESMPTDALNDMVKEINTIEVSPLDRLSDHVYRYSAQTEEISIC